MEQQLSLLVCTFAFFWFFVSRNWYSWCPSHLFQDVWPFQNQWATWGCPGFYVKLFLSRGQFSPFVIGLLAPSDRVSHSLLLPLLHHQNNIRSSSHALRGGTRPIKGPLFFVDLITLSLPVSWRLYGSHHWSGVPKHLQRAIWPLFWPGPWMRQHFLFSCRDNLSKHVIHIWAHAHLDLGQTSSLSHPVHGLCYLHGQ